MAGWAALGVVPAVVDGVVVEGVVVAGAAVVAGAVVGAAVVGAVVGGVVVGGVVVGGTVATGAVVVGAAADVVDEFVGGTAVFELPHAAKARPTTNANRTVRIFRTSKIYPDPKGFKASTHPEARRTVVLPAVS